MNLNRSFALSFALALSSAACTSESPGPDPGPDTGECSDPGKAGCLVASTKQRQAPSAPAADVTELVTGNTAFTLDLYQQLRAQPGNLFYSPFSISEALAMTWAGARGETETEMAKALRFTLPQEKLHPAFNALDTALMSRGKGAKGKDGQGFRLNVANALWGQTSFPFEAPFLDTLAENYGAGMHVVDFQGSPEPSRALINQWVADRTEDKIQDLMPKGSVTGDTRLVLTNAVYFNAAWQTPFEPGKTKDADFTRKDGSKVTVQTLSGFQETGYASGAGWAATAIPYDGGELSMLFILPDAGTFAAFDASLTAEKLGTIADSLSYSDVTMTLPKFKFTSSFGLVEQLSKLGMPAAFSDSADFSGITKKGGLSISDVVHKAYIGLDEAGTEAAAATGVAVGVTSAPPLAEIHLDHPFLFFIRDNQTGAILFFGRMEDPSAG